MQKIEKLKSVCLQYAASIQLLVPSMYVPEVASTNDGTGSFGLGRSKPWRSKNKNRQLKLAAENTIICDSIMYEAQYTSENSYFGRHLLLHL